MNHHNRTGSGLKEAALIALLALVSLGARGAWQQGKPERDKPKKPQPTAQPTPAIAPEIQAALVRISADSLRGHLSFIASDLLEGRGTPSRGLDIAAEYIAAQFRRAGLEPVGDASEKSYFQTANWKVREPNVEGFELTLSDGAQTIRLNANQVGFAGSQPIELKDVSLLKIDSAETLAQLKPEQVGGKVVINEMPDVPTTDRAKYLEAQRAQNELANKIKALNPAFIVTVVRGSSAGRGLGASRLIDPERGEQPGPANAAYLSLHDQRAAALYDVMKPGETKGSLSLRLPAPVERPVKLRNVVGLLRGSDPVLQDSYVLVTAHYDHVGTRADGEDRIFNGANDDGSGTVSVIELASALTTLKSRPKRSILFMAVFGEERGLLGSRYYGRHPIFPIEKTIADVNLEHVGRTDDTEGDKTGTATLTGFDYTDVSETFKKAGELTGINVYKHERNSDSFFGRSDNQALADQGVPAHTLCVAFIFPDYHQVGDHWDKINYPNLAQTNRMVALALLMLANNPVAPKWNEANPKTARYVQAWKARRGQ